MLLYCSTDMKQKGFFLLDLLLIPISYLGLKGLKLVRKFGLPNFPQHRKLFESVGVFPILNHYYEPQYIFPADFDALAKRKLHLDFAVEKQLVFLNSLHFVEELKVLSSKENSDNTPSSNSDDANLDLSNGIKKNYRFTLENPAFGAGDAEMYYLLIRNLKPKRIIEIGSGHSTLLALEAIRKNTADGYPVTLTCIEPYEFSWLQEIPAIQLIRKKVEDIELDFFATLEPNDILFIDSSHIIRPNNDVLFEYLELLPTIQSGVWVHIHDIFTPRNYPKRWLQDEVKLWNEQYLLEAFLHNNKDYEIACSLNYLAKDYYAATSAVLINLQPTDNPGSFWIKRVQ